MKLVRAATARRTQKTGGSELKKSDYNLQEILQKGILKESTLQ